MNTGPSLSRYTDQKSASAFPDAGRSGLVVSAFFAVYQTVKCGFLAADVTYPEVRVGGATLVALAPVSAVAALRRLTPYCLTLVAVDTYHTYVAPDSTK